MTRSGAAVIGMAVRSALGIRRPIRLERMLAALLLGTLVGLVMPSVRVIAATDDPRSAVTIEAQPLLAGNIRPGEWMALRVHLENSGPAVTGELRLETSGRTGSSFGREVELPTGARQDHVIYGQAGPFGSRMVISIVSEGSTVASTKAAIDAMPQDGMGVFVVAEHPERLMGDIRASVERRQGASRVVAIEPDGLPPRAEAWSSVDHLVWQDVPIDRLDAERLDALATWVALGGELTIVGGSAGAGPLDGMPQELLPFRPTGTVDVPLSDLEGLLGSLPAGATPLPALAGRLERGSILAESAGQAIAARLGYGQGAVTLLGIDPSAPWLTGTQASTALWTRILPPADATAGQVLVAGQSDDVLVDALTYLPSVETPRMDQLLLLVVGYLILLGPVNYVVLRRLDRREWAWVTIPALAIAFTAGALVLGIVLRGTNVVVNQLGIVRGAAGADRGVADVFVGVFSPTRQTFDVSLPGGALVSPPVLQWAQEQRLPLDVLLGDPARVRGLQVGYGDVRGFHAQAAVHVPRVDTSLRLVEGHVQGSVTNASEIVLEHVALAQGGGVQLLGELGPGETRDVDVAPGRGTSATAEDFARLAGATDDARSGDPRGWTSRMAIIRSLAGDAWWDDGTQPDPLAGLGPVIVAWRPGGALEVDVGAAADQVGDTLYLLPVRVEASGPVSFAGNLVRHSVLEISAVDGWEDPSGFYLSRGTMTVDYRPTRLDAAMDVTGLLIRLDRSAELPVTGTARVLPPLPDTEQPDQEDPLRGVAVDAPGDWRSFRIQLLDRETDRWVEFGQLERGASYRIEDAPRYVDPTGAVRVRFVSRATDPPMFRLGLTIEAVVR